MTATINVLGSIFNTTAGNKTVTATPSVGDLIVVIAVATGVTSTVADNGTGGTYTQVGTTRTGFSTTGNLQIFVRNNLVTSSVSTVYTATQTSSTGGGLLVFRVTGVTLTGAAAVRSSGGQSTGTAGTTPAPVLSLTPLATNPIITAVASANTVAGSVLTQRTGYTEDFDNIYSTPATAMEVNHLISGETSATLTQGSTSTTAFASQSIELILNTPPTTALNTPADLATGVSTTPTLNFTGTDADGDTGEYEVQVDTVNTFDSQTTNPTIVQSTNYNSGASTSSTGTIVFSSTPTVGNLLLICMSYAGTKHPTGTPSGQIWQQIDDLENGTSAWLTTYYHRVNAGETNSYAFTTTGADFLAIVAYEISGVNYAAPINQHSAATGSSTTQATPSVTPSVLNCLAIAFVAFNDGTTQSGVAATAGAGWTVDQDPLPSFHSCVGASRNTRTTDTTTAITASITWGTADTNVNSTILLAPNNPLINARSTSDAGFTAGHPFASGVAKDYTVQSALANSTQYFWRVHEIDPTGSISYGAFSPTRSFTTVAGGGGGGTQFVSFLAALGVG